MRTLPLVKSTFSPHIVNFTLVPCNESRRSIDFVYYQGQLKRKHRAALPPFVGLDLSKRFGFGFRLLRVVQA